MNKTYIFDDSRTDTHKTFSLRCGDDFSIETFEIEERVDRQEWRRKKITLMEICDKITTELR